LKFACPSLEHIAHYSCKKFSPTPYQLATVGYIRYTQTDGRRPWKQFDSYLSTVG